MVNLARSSKKGQMEIAGLVFIVILITLGMLFLTKFALKNSSEKKVFTTEGLAVSTMTSLMLMTVHAEGCEGLQVEKDLIDDCAEFNSFGSSEYNCDGKDSCAYLQEVIANVLKQTLGQWKKKYTFQSSLSTLNNKAMFDPIISELGGCPKTVERDSSGEFPLNTGAGVVSSVLYVCD